MLFSLVQFLPAKKTYLVKIYLITLNISKKNVLNWMSSHIHKCAFMSKNVPKMCQNVLKMSRNVNKEWFWRVPAICIIISCSKSIAYCQKKISILVFNPFSVAVKYGRMTKRARDAVYQEFKNEFCKTDDDESGPDTPNSIDNGSLSSLKIRPTLFFRFKF